MIAVDCIDLPGRRHGWPDQRDDLVVLQELVDAVGSRSLERGHLRFPVGRVAEALGLLGLLEQLLSEQAHFLFLMSLVERDEVGEAAWSDRCWAALQVGAHVGL